jgi:hypothetical protein
MHILMDLAPSLAVFLGILVEAIKVDRKAWKKSQEKHIKKIPVNNPCLLYLSENLIKAQIKASSEK